MKTPRRKGKRPGEPATVDDLHEMTIEELKAWDPSLSNKQALKVRLLVRRPYEQLQEARRAQSQELETLRKAEQGRKSRDILGYEAVGRIVTKARDADAPVLDVYFDDSLKKDPQKNASAERRKAWLAYAEQKARATREARRKLSREIGTAFTAERVAKSYPRNQDKALGQVIRAKRVILVNRHLLSIMPARDELFELLEELEQVAAERRRHLKSGDAKDATFDMTPGGAFIHGLAKAYETMTGAKAGSGIRATSTWETVGPFIVFCQAVEKETQRPISSPDAIRMALTRSATEQKSA